MADSTTELCEKVLTARKQRDEIKATLASAEEALSKIEGELAAALQEEGPVEAGGFKFTATRKVRWKILSEGKDNLLGLLKTGAPELVKETVNASSLNSYLNKNEDQLETKGAGWWSDAKKCLARHDEPSLSVRKAPAKKAAAKPKAAKK